MAKRCGLRCRGGERVRVDVVIPTYFRSATLGRALESVIEQGEDRIGKVVIPDNGDDVETIEVLDGFRDRLPALEHHRWGENLGAIGNWRRGIEQCEAEWIVVLWSDDALAPGAVARMIDATGPRIASVSGQARIHIPGRSWLAFSGSRLDLDFNGVARGLLSFPPDLPVSPAAGIVRRSDALDGLLQVDYLPECYRRAIGPDVGLFYWGAARGRTHVHLPVEVGVMHGGDDSITMNTARALRSSCYVSAVERMGSAAGWEFSADVERLIRHRHAGNRLMRAPSEVEDSMGRLSPVEAVRDALRIARAGAIEMAQRVHSRRR